MGFWRAWREGWLEGIGLEGGEPWEIRLQYIETVIKMEPGRPPPPHKKWWLCREAGLGTSKNLIDIPLMGLHIYFLKFKK